MDNSSSTVPESLHCDQLMQKLKGLFLRQQELMANLKLAAYVADAMRVLQVLEQQADMSEAFSDTLKSVCADWRNPGSIEQPADLIAVALGYVVAALQQILTEMDQAIGAVPSR
ncbi:MAG: hypothetical protein ACOZE7_01270 [Pseudomonadota bacterium]|jgi:predicted RNA-binding protein with EMAP domain|uniref:hypothetical protein n=1 Tax=Aquabacterium parvum TaxID=70584 RepID=UPI00128F57E1|nr:hypothetical protein [Aquabacterium parvum]|tara:strand:- start:112 stop:453 length:342 start_codon:yes stop_codon:yes gene_type:complete